MLGGSLGWQPAKLTRCTRHQRSNTNHPAPEGTPGRKKRPRQVSYLFGKVLMSTFRKAWFRNI